MTRKTYYLPERLADTLAEEIDRLREQATDGRLSRAAVMTEIIRAGLERSDTVAERLRRRLEDHWGF